jgi:hypothetical protein
MEETGSGQKKCEGRKQEVNGRNRQQEEHVHSQYTHGMVSGTRSTPDVNNK